MLNRLLAILTCLCISTGCANRGKWRKIDTAATVAMGALLYMDYRQTTGPDGIFDRCLEANPILGDECSRGGMPIEMYLSMALVAHTAVAIGLPTDWRRGWQGLGLGLEGHSVWLNWQGEGHNPFK